jgi:hypothetical protein
MPQGPQKRPLVRFCPPHLWALNAENVYNGPVARLWILAPG